MPRHKIPRLAYPKIIFLSIVILLTAVFYRLSFTSLFFQDDFVVLRSEKISDFFTTLPSYRYYPVSVQLFYSVSKALFGLNPVGFHLILFLVFSATLPLIYNLVKIITRDDKKAAATVFFYSFNISLFAYFYWVASSYFVIGGFFIFLSLYLYFSQEKIFLSLAAFIPALLSNELSIVLPGLLIIIAWYLRKKLRLFSPFILIDGLYILFKQFVIGISPNPDYSPQIFSAFSNFRWYLFRALNLPEGVKRSENMLIIFLFVLFLVLLSISFFLLYKKRKVSFRLIIFCFLFFTIAAFPFFFLPGHMSSYYLGIALFGSSLFLAQILTVDLKLLIVSFIIYFLLSFQGLTFLSKTHWIILKNTPPLIYLKLPSGDNL